jgi:peptidoglycan hydrolase-like protein with peptidoglycan-binding domain
MTIFYPDISAFQAGISVAGATAVCVKATEGSGWFSSDYDRAMAQAKADGVFAFAYHFLHAGNVSAQAAWCFSHVAATPLMLDFEPTLGSDPTIVDAVGFMNAYRSMGGKITLNYFPHWYWQQLGSPSLSPLASLGLVSSVYTTYADASSAAGWLPYGGVSPVVWQYTNAGRLAGSGSIDFNAYRGTLAEFETLVSGAVMPPPLPPPPPSPAPAFPYPSADYLGVPSSDKHCHSGYFGGIDNVNVHTWQERMSRRGWSIAMDGCYGPASASVCKTFQAEKGLAVDGFVGPMTWTAAWTAPVT